MLCGQVKGTVNHCLYVRAVLRALRPEYVARATHRDECKQDDSRASIVPQPADCLIPSSNRATANTTTNRKRGGWRFIPAPTCVASAVLESRCHTNGFISMRAIRDVPGRRNARSQRLSPLTIEQAHASTILSAVDSYAAGQCNSGGRWIS